MFLIQSYSVSISISTLQTKQLLDDMRAILDRSFRVVDLLNGLSSRFTAAVDRWLKRGFAENLQEAKSEGGSPEHLMPKWEHGP